MLSLLIILLLFESLLLKIEKGLLVSLVFELDPFPILKVFELLLLLLSILEKEKSNTLFLLLFPLLFKLSPLLISEIFFSVEKGLLLLLFTKGLALCE